MANYSERDLWRLPNISERNKPWISQPGEKENFAKRKPMRGHGPRRDMKAERQQFSGDFVKVRDHQQQPLDAVKVVASAPACSIPCTAPATPPSDCISMMLGVVPKIFALPFEAHSSLIMITEALTPIRMREKYGP